MKPLKILHTADWHLGQRLMYLEREPEQAAALEWLHQCICEEQVDILIVAGDVFDLRSPPNTALKLYYRFLTGLLHSPCRHVIITGGNHDSPAVLNAPRELLEVLNVYVVGGATDTPEDCILRLKDPEGAIEAVVAAVPFLRDQDLKTSIAGETGLDRLERIRQGLLKYYENVGALAEAHTHLNVPLLATGHLYAKGAVASGKQDNIYLGDMENIDAAGFPEVFDYIALGHLHKAQPVGQDRIRYSGSLIPLSFVESRDKKSVTLLEFEGRTLQKTRILPVPQQRRLASLRGDLPAVEPALTRLAEEAASDKWRPWVEVVVDAAHFIPQLDTHLQDFARDLPLDIIKIGLNYPRQSLDEQLAGADLTQLDVLDVFEKRCDSLNLPEVEKAALTETFLELKEWYEQRE